MIALLTDFGLKDEYVGVMKGVIYSINPEAKITDLTHKVSPQNIIWAGFVLYKSYKYFPKGTIFLCVVDPGVGTERSIIILEIENYYFIAPDNGVLTLLYNNLEVRKIIKVDKNKFSLRPLSSTFHGRDIFAPVAGYLSKEKNLGNFGEEIQEIKLIDFPAPKFSENEILAQVIYIDRFGNLITNLGKEEFQRLSWRNIKIFVRENLVEGIVNSYSEGEKLVALWESRDLLEIASPNDSAARVLGVGIGEVIRIKRE